MTFTGPKIAGYSNWISIKGRIEEWNIEYLSFFYLSFFLRRFLPSLFAILNPCNLRPIPARRVFKRSSTRICISAVCIPSEAKSDIKSWEGWKGGSERESLFDEDRSSGRSAVPRVRIIFRRISDASDWSLSGNGIERIRRKKKRILSLIGFFFFFFFKFSKQNMQHTR